MPAIGTNGSVVAPFIFLLLFTSAFGSPLQHRNFKRPDPFRHFKNYNGSFDIGNKHYWASAAFTGVHGYAMSVVWVVCGLSFGIFAAWKNPSRRASSPPSAEESDRYYFFLFMLVFLFSFLAIVATGFIFAESRTTLRTTKKLKNTIIGAGKDAFQSIRKIITAMIKMEYLLLPYDPNMSKQLNTTTHKLRRESLVLQVFVRNTGRSLEMAINASYISHLVIAIINLLLLVAAVVVLLLHWHPMLIVVIFVCWLVTALCWFLTGIDFFFHTFAEDVCAALEDYVQNPHNNSLSSMLPCMSPSTSDKILTRIGSSVHNFISELDSKMLEVFAMLGLNQGNDLVGFGMVCDPFTGAPNYGYVPENCPKNAIPIGELPNILSNFVCRKDDSPQVCASDNKFISEDTYNQASAYSQSAQDMMDSFPDLQRLAKCTMVTGTFSDIVDHQCKPFRKTVRLLWSSMLCLSVFMMCLQLTWLAKVYQERGRRTNLEMDRQSFRT